MPRLFTGLEVPEPFRSRLSLLRGGLSGARWIEPDDYHVTLRFIGDVDDRTAYEVTDLLSRTDRQGFEVVLEGLGAFGGGKPRALYAAVKPSTALSELQAEQERLCRRVGLEPETRKYTPHVTLARLNRDASPEAVAAYLASRSGPLGRFPVSRFALFSARASVGGGPYLVEETFSLRSPARAGSTS